MSVSEYHFVCAFDSALGLWDLSHSMGLKLNKTFLIGCSHKGCVTIAPAHLGGRTDFRSRVLWLGRFPYFSHSVACKVSDHFKYTRAGGVGVGGGGGRKFREKQPELPGNWGAVWNPSEVETV